MLRLLSVGQTMAVRGQIWFLDRDSRNFRQLLLQVCSYISLLTISEHLIRWVLLDIPVPAAGRLNDGQRDCLRLVLAHLNSKDIALELGVSPHTVDEMLFRLCPLWAMSDRELILGSRLERHQHVSP
jgi:DNA-binding NarL/FixJ family response regulator